MELSSRRFILAVEKAIASPNPCCGAARVVQSPPGQEDSRSFKVITVTEENRDVLVEEIAKEIKGKR